MTQQNLIVKVFEGSKVFFMEDGYINATKAAKNFGKRTENWTRTDETQEYIKAITRKSVIEQNQLVIVKPGAPSTGGGTWLHPKLAIVFARWLSADNESLTMQGFQQLSLIDMELLIVYNMLSKCQNLFVRLQNGVNWLGDASNTLHLCEQV